MKINFHSNSFLKYLFYKYKNLKFKSSEFYWEQRYASGGNSGAGSYSRLAGFKAEVLNEFVDKNKIKDVIEFGCGDGNQLSLATYPKYIGFDVSKTAIQNCIHQFKTDSSKSFYLYNSEAFSDNHHLFKADLVLSLDVIYHLVEDRIFDFYMRHLFETSRKYVIIYASNNDGQLMNHVRERNFTRWVDAHCSDWKLVEVIKNKYPSTADDSGDTSPSDFYIYKKN